MPECNAPARLTAQTADILDGGPVVCFCAHGCSGFDEASHRLVFVCFARVSAQKTVACAAMSAGRMPVAAGFPIALRGNGSSCPAPLRRASVRATPEHFQCEAVPGRGSTRPPRLRPCAAARPALVCGRVRATAIYAALRPASPAFLLCSVPASPVF